jgi:hypothetical protein
LFCFSLFKKTKNRKPAKQKKTKMKKFKKMKTWKTNKEIVCIDNLEQKMRLTNNALVSTVWKNTSTNLRWVQQLFKQEWIGIPQSRSYLIAIVWSDASFDFCVNPKLVLPDVATHVQQDGLELKPDLLRTVPGSIRLTRDYRSELFYPTTVNKIWISHVD